MRKLYRKEEIDELYEQSKDSDDFITKLKSIDAEYSISSDKNRAVVHCFIGVKTIRLNGRILQRPDWTQVSYDL